MGRGRFANQSETKRSHVDGPCPSRARGAPASGAGTASARGARPSSAGKLPRPIGSAAHGHSIADDGSNVLHLLFAETVEANG